MKERVAFLGHEYGFNGIYLTIDTVPPTELPEE
jgi:hypothetical protein